jgi:hypothetical protein
MRDLGEAHVPFTNYGIFFSWAAAPEALRRALEPWGLEPPAAKAVVNIKSNENGEA